MLLKIFSIYDPGPSMQENYFYLSLQFKFLDLMDFTAQNYTKHIFVRKIARNSID